MRFLDFPPEIRTQIYSVLLDPTTFRRELNDGYAEHKYGDLLNLYLTNQQIYYESRRIFRQLNTFVRIRTPWADAKSHVEAEGRVSILASGPLADKFDFYTLCIEIDAPVYVNRDNMQSWVMTAEDLNKFCKYWFYTNLSITTLNPHLTMELILRDPYAREDEDKTVPKALQKRLFEPFGQIKNLQGVSVSGSPQPYTSIITEMRAEMARPMDSPEKCLSDATRLKDLGNVELKAGRYTEALDFYRQAWLAMHIIIRGMDRQVHGDQYFDRMLEEDPFKNQHGGTVRVVLRIRLVANTVLAYYCLGNYDMAIHTGMRTIRIMRASLGLEAEEEAADPAQETITQFVAAPELGKIYYRTALAYRALNDKAEARKLLRVAVIYLPHDPPVHQALATCALRI